MVVYCAPNGTMTSGMMWALWWCNSVHNAPMIVFAIADWFCFSLSSILVQNHLEILCATRRAHIFDLFLLWAQPRNPHLQWPFQVEPWSDHPQFQDAVESGHGSNTFCRKLWCTVSKTDECCSCVFFCNVITGEASRNAERRSLRIHNFIQPNVLSSMVVRGMSQKSVSLSTKWFSFGEFCDTRCQSVTREAMKILVRLYFVAEAVAEHLKSHSFSCPQATPSDHHSSLPNQPQNYVRRPSTAGERAKNEKVSIQCKMQNIWYMIFELGEVQKRSLSITIGRLTNHKQRNTSEAACTRVLWLQEERLSNTSGLWPWETRRMVCDNAWDTAGFYGSEGLLPLSCDEWLSECCTRGKRWFISKIFFLFDTKNSNIALAINNSNLRQKLQWLRWSTLALTLEIKTKPIILCSYPRPSFYILFFSKMNWNILCLNMSLELYQL